MVETSNSRNRRQEKLLGTEEWQTKMDSSTVSALDMRAWTSPMSPGWQVSIVFSYTPVTRESVKFLILCSESKHIKSPRLLLRAFPSGLLEFTWGA